ncbi:monovalent cation/H+ antiporter complex subunit F [Streptomyces sp. KL116D]|uniref:monovalent cation/H+ antiporter complex subunit F n=1 Tax=Streptomyces sp. KL116D TaxID=3045152 RepID=UPI0035583F7D
MTMWAWACVVLAVGGLAPSALLALRGSPLDRTAALTLASTVATALFLAFAQAVGRTSYTDLALVLALLGPIGVLVFTRCVPLGRDGDGDGED